MSRSVDADFLALPLSSVSDAAIKIHKAIHEPHVNQGKISDYNDGTIDRVCDILEGKGEEYLRMSTDYRKHTREAKY